MVEERMTIWDKPWPDAPLRDGVLMMCAQTEDGWERDQLASRLHMPGVLLGRTLTHLVNDGWLKVAHQYGGPSGASVYTIDSRRAGLREMKTLWHLEHGFVSGELDAGFGQEEPAVRLDDHERGLLDQAVAHGAGPGSTVPAPVYRQLRAAAIEQSGRTFEIWHNMQAAWADSRNERAREMIHLEGAGEMELPVPGPNPVDPTCRRELLLLALTCRRRARDVAAKFQYLSAANAAAVTRAHALSSGRDPEHNALEPLVALDAKSADDALRMAVSGAVASRFLKEQWKWASTLTAGLGGDLMIAYLYRSVAKQLEEIIARINAMPAVAEAARSVPGRELLGEAASLSAGTWPGFEASVITEDVPRLRDDKLGERIDVSGPAELQAGQWVVAVGGMDLSTEVVVTSVSTEEGAVTVAVPEGHSEYVVPTVLLEHAEGLTVREPLR